MVYNTTQHPPPPPPHSHTLSVFTGNLLWEGGEGGRGQREVRGATVHKYRAFAHAGNSSQAGSEIPTMSDVSPVFKIC